MRVNLTREFVQQQTIENLNWWLFGMFPWPRNKYEVDYYQAIINAMKKEDIIKSIIDMSNKIKWC